MRASDLAVHERRPLLPRADEDVGSGEDRHHLGDVDEDVDRKGPAAGAEPVARLEEPHLEELLGGDDQEDDDEDELAIAPEPSRVRLHACSSADAGAPAVSQAAPVSAAARARA